MFMRFFSKKRGGDGFRRVLMFFGVLGCFRVHGSDFKVQGSGFGVLGTRSVGPPSQEHFC